MGNTVERVVSCNSEDPNNYAATGDYEPRGSTEQNDSISSNDTRSLDARLRSETIDEFNGSPGTINGLAIRNFPPGNVTRTRAATVDERVDGVSVLPSHLSQRRSLDERVLTKPPGARRSVSQRLSRFTSGLFEAMTVVVAQKKAFVAEGMTPSNFALGVVNALVTAYLVGSDPAAYWLYYAVQATLLLSIRTATWWSQKLQFYLLDFCWITNYLLNIVALMAAYEYMVHPLLFGVDSKPPWQPLPDYLLRTGWPAVFTITTGPLTWAVAATGNSLVFHSFEHTASMFIHASPMIAAWCLRWHADTVEKYYPGLLGTPAESPAFWADMFLPSIVFYGAWWVLYVLWLLLDGTTRPERGYDTVFGNFAPSMATTRHDVLRRPLRAHPQLCPDCVRSDSPLFARTGVWTAVVMDNLGISSLKCAAFSYCQAHFIACALCFAVATLAYRSYIFHTTLLVAMLLSAILSGSKMYSFFMLDAYEAKLREKLHPASATSAKDLV